MAKNTSQKILEMVAIVLLLIGGGVVGVNYLADRNKHQEREREKQASQTHVPSPSPKVVPAEPTLPILNLETAAQLKPRIVPAEGNVDNQASAGGEVILFQNSLKQSNWEVWNTTKCERICQLDLSQLPKNDVPKINPTTKKIIDPGLFPAGLCLSPDGTRAAGCIGYGYEMARRTLTVWDAKTGKVIWQHYDPNREILQLQFKSAQQMFCVVTPANQNYVGWLEKIDIDSDRVEVLPLESWRAHECRIALRGDKLVFGDSDHQYLFDLQTQQLREFASLGIGTLQETVRRLDFSSDGARLLISRNTLKEVWNATSLAREKTIAFDSKTGNQQGPGNLLKEVCGNLVLSTAGFTAIVGEDAAGPSQAIGHPVELRCVGISQDRQTFLLDHNKLKQLYFVRFSQPLPANQTVDLTPLLEKTLSANQTK